VASGLAGGEGGSGVISRARVACWVEERLPPTELLVDGRAQVETDAVNY
jgi:hypothetical protein